MISRDTPIFLAGHTGLVGSAFGRWFGCHGFSRVQTSTHRELDLADAKRTLEYFQATRPTLVIMAAGRTGGIVANETFPADLMKWNLGIQSSTLEAARQSGVEHFVFFGSSCMYPKVSIQPMKEELLLSGFPEPTSVSYSVAKLAGLYQCLALNIQSRSYRYLPVIPNNVYGPNDSFDPETSHVMAALIRKFHMAKVTHKPEVTLWGTGRPRREFIHADDVADAVMHLLQSPLNELTFPINIGTGIDVSIHELSTLVARAVGYTGETKYDNGKPDGAPRKLLDSSRLRATGWVPKIDLSRGIKETYQWFQNTAGKEGSE